MGSKFVWESKDLQFDEDIEKSEDEEWHQITLDLSVNVRVLEKEKTADGTYVYKVGFNV